MESCAIAEAPGQAGSAATLRARAKAAERRLGDVLAGLARSTDQLAADRQFRAMLWGRMRLWYYGSLNLCLIFDQCPAATWVRGPKQWERLGRTVRQGARPIELLAPSRPLKPWPFKVIHVYDVSQTDGPALAESSFVFHGELEAIPAIEKAIALMGIELVEARPGELWSQPLEDALGEARGGRILVRPGLRPYARLRVLVHELAHELLHTGKRQRDRRGRHVGSEAVREAEADATAFLVLDQLGLRYNCPSYVVFHGGTGETLLRSFKRILAAARAIRTALDGKRPRVRIPRLTFVG